MDPGGAKRTMVPSGCKSSLRDYGFTGGIKKVDGGKKGRKRRSKNAKPGIKLESFGFTLIRADEMVAGGKVQGGGGGKEDATKSNSLENDVIHGRDPNEPADPNPNRKRKTRGWSLEKLSLEPRRQSPTRL